MENHHQFAPDNTQLMHSELPVCQTPQNRSLVDKERRPYSEKSSPKVYKHTLTRTYRSYQRAADGTLTVEALGITVPPTPQGEPDWELLVEKVSDATSSQHLCKQL